MLYLSVPFPENDALNVQQLLFEQCLPTAVSTSKSRATVKKSKKSISYLPGCPNIPLSANTISGYVRKELFTPILEELYPHLWLVARRSGSSIDPLHLHATKGPNIYLTEDSQLHLVWRDDRIYIKPVPVWLLNHEVWLHYLTAPGVGPNDYSNVSDETQIQPSLMNVSDPPQCSIAIGFLRSYACLIQYHSDFVIAHQHHLLPLNLDWTSWMRFIAHFSSRGDHEVSSRYHNGQLRLSRLHWAVRLFRPPSAPNRWFYYLPHWSTTPYLKSILAPLAFTFATISLVLSAMQVVVSIPANGLKFSGVDNIGLKHMKRAFWVFSIWLLMSSCILWVLLLAIPAGVIIWQLWWGFSNRHKRSEI
jgi:hypothetical protein